jgi:hypothetical protein
MGPDGARNQEQLLARTITNLLYWTSSSQNFLFPFLSFFLRVTGYAVRSSESCSDIVQLPND